MLFPLPGTPFSTFIWRKLLHTLPGEIRSLLEGPQPHPPPPCAISFLVPRGPAGLAEGSSEWPDVSPSTEPPDGTISLSPWQSQSHSPSWGPTGPFFSVASRMQACGLYLSYVASSLSWERTAASPQSTHPACVPDPMLPALSRPLLVKESHKGNVAAVHVTQDYTA